jgi:hypothetical protein
MDSSSEVLRANTMRSGAIGTCASTSLRWVHVNSCRCTICRCTDCPPSRMMSDDDNVISESLSLRGGKWYLILCVTTCWVW